MLALSEAASFLHSSPTSISEPSSPIAIRWLTTSSGVAFPVPPSVLDDISAAEASLREARIRLASLQSQQSSLGDRIRKTRSPGQQLDASAASEGVISGFKAAAAALRKEIAPALRDVEATEDRLLKLGLSLPNTSHSASPIGPYSSSNVIDIVGDVPAATAGHLDSTAQATPDPRRDHLNVLTALGWLSFEDGQKTTGGSFPVLKGPAALLEIALIQYAIVSAIRSGWNLVLGPDVVQTEVAERCGFAPRDAGEVGQTFFVSSPRDGISVSSMCLAATAEIPVTASHHSITLPTDRYPRFPCEPVKLTSVGRAFRAEAGARGTESRGLYRVHQFTKVELVAMTAGRGEESDVMLGEMVALQKRILQQLGLPFRSERLRDCRTAYSS